MAYHPGVPDVGPAPVSPMAGGKPGRVQHMGSIVGRRTAGMSTVSGGDGAMHSIGHYGKNAPPLLGGAQAAGGIDPTAHSGAKMIRGGAGKPSSHVRTGGLGPGKLSAPGPSNTDYSLRDNQDVE